MMFLRNIRLYQINHAESIRWIGFAQIIMIRSFLYNQSDQRKQVIDICKSMKISYIGVVQSNEQYRMKECSVLYEVCDRMNNSNA